MPRKVCSNRENGPPGTIVRASGRHGPQVVATTGRFWSDEAEAIFLDHLATTCNVTLSAEAAGFSGTTLWRRRRRDAGFAERWNAALAQGYTRLEAAVVRRATETFDGDLPDPDSPIPAISTADALNLLRLHRQGAAERRARNGRRRLRSLDEVRRSILVKLEAVIAMSEEEAAAPCDPLDGLAASSSDGD